MISHIKAKLRKLYHKNRTFHKFYAALSCLKTDVLKIIPDKQFLKMKFRENTGQSLDLDHPKTFNMKMQWLKLYDRNPLYTRLADKYAVRKYVAHKCGANLTNTLYGVYSSVNEIDFKKLPDQFVLKCTHDCGSVVICKEKKIFDRNSALKMLGKAMKRNYFWVGREWPYKHIKPRIIAEKYLADAETGELNDYKVFCFDGIPRIIQVDYDRFRDHKRNLYDTKWNYLGYTTLYPTDPRHKIEKPKCLDKLLDYAAKLSEGIPFVRVDFYIVEDKPVFGEMTFFHGGGMEPFYPPEYDEKLGKMLVLRANA